MERRRVDRCLSFEYRRERDRELLELFNRELGNQRGESVEEVLRRVVEKPTAEIPAAQAPAAEVPVRSAEHGWLWKLFHFWRKET